MKKLVLALFLFASVAFGAGKDFIPPNLIITNCAMTGTATCTSSVVDIRGFDDISIQANWSGTPNGTFFVDVCNDYNSNTGNTGTWSTIAGSPNSPAGSASTSTFDAVQICAAYIRVRYTNTSSTGTLNVYLGAKAL